MYHIWRNKGLKPCDFSTLLSVNLAIYEDAGIVCLLICKFDESQYAAGYWYEFYLMLLKKHLFFWYLTNC